MTRLLVSVRNRSEALTALAASADLLDIKEPRRGALGRAAATTIAEIALAVAGRVPVSAALGELAEWDESQAAECGSLVQHLQFAKIGLARSAFSADWPERWHAFNEHLPAGTAPVAVVYADEAAQAPPAAEIIAQAVQANCRAVLIDTFDKSAGSLLDQWDRPRIRDSIQQIQAHGMLAVLGGGLTESAITALLPLAPDILAVRTAACTANNRTAPICPHRIRRLRALLA